MAKETKLVYPKSVEGTGAYLQFRAYDYATAQAEGWNKDIRDGAVNPARNTTFADTFNTDNATEALGQSILSGLTSSSANSSSPVDNSAVGSVYLYLPNKLEYSYGADWKKMQFGALGSVLNEGYLPIGQAAGTALASFGNFIANNITKNEIFQSIPKQSGIDLDGVLGAAFGVVFNDNTIQTFEKMSTRTFNYDYILVARNPTEEQDIKSIIKFFKLAMHPTAKANNKSNSLFLGYPYVFRIIPSGYKASIKNDPNDPTRNTWNLTRKKLSEFMPQTKYCGLTRFNVDYTPDNVIALLRGSSFVQAVRISMSFAELTTLTRQDIEQFEDPSSFSFDNGGR
jgi:hypothetical protein